MNSNYDIIDPVNLLLEFKNSDITEETNTTEQECCICFENIGSSNNCITPCGHKFCFTCIAKNISYSNVCPFCRYTLIEKNEEDEDEDIDEDDDEDVEDDEDEDDNYNEDEPEGSLETITRLIQEKGYTYMDLVSSLIGRYSKNNNENTNNDDYYSKMFNDIDDIINETDEEAIRESEEREMFANEDKNVLNLTESSDNIEEKVM